MLLFLVLAFAAALGLTAPPAAAAELERRASLGLQLGPAESGSGVAVQAVVPGQTGAALELRPGDVIVGAGGAPVPDAAALVRYAGGLAAGDPVDLVVLRDGKELRVRGEAVPRPRESWSGASVDYGAVPFRGGLLRDILVTPGGVADPPILFLLQGFSCVSIEPPSPSHPYRMLGEAMVDRGIGYYRVEKPGIGDSAGGVNCAEIDFETEVDAFRAAYRHLVEERGVDPKRIFMFGHSLGGIQAPLLAAETAPRGVAVFGTVLRNWADYHQDLSRFQGLMLFGQDPVEQAREAERNREIYRLYYHERQSPAAIAAARPDLADAVREAIAWDGGERAMGRHYEFMQDLAHVPLTEAWRDSDTQVLSIYGESDVVALFDDDHRLIADVANFYRPGSGAYIEIAGTDHGMGLVGDRQEIRRRTMAQGQPPAAPFNPEVGRVLADWIGRVMASPHPPARAQNADAGAPE